MDKKLGTSYYCVKPEETIKNICPTGYNIDSV